MGVRREVVLINSVKNLLCTKCKSWHPITNFNKRSDGRYKDGSPKYRSWCKECDGASKLEHYYSKRRGNKHRLCSYRYILKSRYGISEEIFTEMYNSQEGRCCICDKGLGNMFLDVNGLRPVVDHCHKTGKVRGLLCNTCNSGIGMLEDSPKLLMKALKYLS